MREYRRVAIGEQGSYEILPLRRVARRRHCFMHELRWFVLAVNHSEKL